MCSGPAKSGFLIATWLVAAAAGCARYAPPDTWAAGEMYAVTGESARPHDRGVFDPARGAINISAAANATAAFQLVADADSHGARNVRVSVSELSGDDGSKLSAEDVDTYRVLPVRVTDYPAWFLLRSADPPAPRDYYDVLVPDGSDAAGEPWDVAPGERFVAWVDIRVPRDTPPGLYRGTVTLSAANRMSKQFQLELEVHDFVLPDSRVLPAVGGFDHRDVFRRLGDEDQRNYVPPRLDRRDEDVREGLTAVRELMRLARRHRLDLFERTMHPVLKRDSRGAARLDWDDYDAIVTPYLDGSAFEDGEPVPFWPVPLHAGWPDAGNYGGAGSDQHLDVVAELAQRIAEHLRPEETSEQRWIYWPVRETSQPAHHLEQEMARAAEALGGLSLLSTLPPETLGSRSARPAEMAAPPGEFFDPDLGGQARTGGLGGVWLTPGVPPYAPSLHVAAPAADVRAMAWVAMRYGAEGLLIPDVLGWSEGDSSCRLFYPGPAYGAEGPLPSARLKRLRRGLEDAAACDLLRQRGREGVARAVANTLIRHAGVEAADHYYMDARLDGWPEDAGTWHRAGRLLAQEVRVALNGREVSERDFLRQRVSWRLLMDRTRSVRLERVSSNVRPAQDGRWRAEMLLDFSNPLAWPVEITVGNIRTPQGWTLADDSENSLELDTNQRGTLRVAMVGEGVAATPDGKLPVELTLDMPGEPRELRTAVPLLIVPTVRRPPRIDGSLRDWPLAQGNAAAGFRLIGRRGLSGDGLATQTTLAMVTRDAENLYFAFRCAEADIEEMLVYPDNRLRHQQAIPFGEDLVEVTLDPAFKASGPEDLYHMAVKANGVVHSARGAPGDPLHSQRPWAAGATAAVDTFDNHWVVELAVPLSAFGEDGDATFWGVNFSRFASRKAEASSWTGDRRCFYLPRVLGTMFMGRSEQD
ncbi:MAG: hypothetical protein ACP5HU_08180 [Phycisphaerae bacterium]